MVWLGLAWFGRFIGLFEHGLAWFGLVWLGLVRFSESKYSLTL